MKKDDEEANEVDDLQPEYDFTGGVRGKYYRPGKTIIRMTVDEDVARYFYSSELLNAGLRTLIAEGRAPEPRDDRDLGTMRIKWDPVKAAENLRKHAVSFDEASDVFSDPFRGVVPDDEHSDDEDRYVALGSTPAGKLLIVFYTSRGEDARLISARRPTRSERRRYMDETPMIYDEPMEPGDEETMHLDWSKMVRGLHYIPREKGTAILDEDVYGIFRTSEEVNNALRMLIKEGRIPHFVSDEEWYAQGKKAKSGND
jgi:uncharacterized DUF497 family protein